MSIKDLIPWNRSKREEGVRRVNEESTIFNLQREMNSLFEEFWRGNSFFPYSGFRDSLNSLGTLALRADISETDNEVNISIELPGVDEKNIDVSLKQGALTIKGEKRDEREEKDGALYRVERSYGSFYRTIPLPDGIDEERVEASFSKGVLKVRLPKTMEARLEVKKIPVKTAA